MGVALVCQVRVCTCRHMQALYRARCMTFQAKYKRYQESESWVKLLVRIRREIEIIYITIVFVGVLVGFVIAAILAQVTWVLSVRTAKTVTWTLTWEWVLACLGHYSIQCSIYVGVIVITRKCSFLPVGRSSLEFNATHKIFGLAQARSNYVFICV